MRAIKKRVSKQQSSSINTMDGLWAFINILVAQDLVTSSSTRWEREQGIGTLREEELGPNETVDVVGCQALTCRFSQASGWGKASSLQTTKCSTSTFRCVIDQLLFKQRCILMPAIGWPFLLARLLVLCLVRLTTSARAWYIVPWRTYEVFETALLHKCCFTPSISCQTYHIDKLITPSNNGGSWEQLQRLGGAPQTRIHETRFY